MSGLYLGDCLDLMPRIADQSINMVLCDPPYGTTACRWDAVIPLVPMWEQLLRVMKPNGAIVFTASQPFTTALIASNYDMFKYEWVWSKTRSTGHVHAKNKPMKKHENVVVFSSGTTVHASQSKNRMPYYPQGLVKTGTTRYRPSGGGGGNGVCTADRPSHKKEWFQEYGNYPTSILEFGNPNNKNVHPTQKPVDLMEYLIRTYTEIGDTVLDFAMGSGTTGVAALNTGRMFIGIEKEPDYFEIAKQRVLGDRT